MKKKKATQTPAAIRPTTDKATDKARDTGAESKAPPAADTPKDAPRAAILKEDATPAQGATPQGNPPLKRKICKIEIEYAEKIRREIEPSLYILQRIYHYLDRVYEKSNDGCTTPREADEIPHCLQNCLCWLESLTQKYERLTQHEAKDLNFFVKYGVFSADMLQALGLLFLNGTETGNEIPASKEKNLNQPSART